VSLRLSVANPPRVPHPGRRRAGVKLPVLARIGVRHKGRADDSHLCLVSKGGSAAFAGSRSRFDERNHAGDRRSKQGHRDQQHHVAVVFPDAHGEENGLGWKTFPPVRVGQVVVSRPQLLCELHRASRDQ